MIFGTPCASATSTRFWKNSVFVVGKKRSGRALNNTPAKWTMTSTPLTAATRVRVAQDRPNNLDLPGTLRSADTARRCTINRSIPASWSRRNRARIDQDYPQLQYQFFIVGTKFSNVSGLISTLRAEKDENESILCLAASIRPGFGREMDQGEMKRSPLRCPAAPGTRLDFAREFFDKPTASANRSSEIQRKPRCAARTQ